MPQAPRLVVYEVGMMHSRKEWTLILFEEMHKLLTEAAVAMPVSGNAHGSYVGTTSLRLKYH